MFRLKESIHVNAPADRCFLLSTSIDLVRKTIRLRPVAGKTSGLVVKNDRILWKGWKFGMPATHETLITQYDRPFFFQDTQGRGRFRFFQHDHNFQEFDGRTTMWDIVRFSMPLGAPGRAFGKRVVVPHVLKLMNRRFEMLRRLAESEDWESFLIGPDGSVPQALADVAGTYPAHMLQAHGAGDGGARGEVDQNLHAGAASPQGGNNLWN